MDIASIMFYMYLHYFLIVDLVSVVLTLLVNVQVTLRVMSQIGKIHQ